MNDIFLPLHAQLLLNRLEHLRQVLSRLLLVHESRTGKGYCFVQLSLLAQMHLCLHIVLQVHYLLRLRFLTELVKCLNCAELNPQTDQAAVKRFVRFNQSYIIYICHFSVVHRCLVLLAQRMQLVPRQFYYNGSEVARHCLCLTVAALRGQLSALTLRKIYLNAQFRDKFLF